MTGDGDYLRLSIPETEVDVEFRTLYPNRHRMVMDYLGIPGSLSY